MLARAGRLDLLRSVAERIVVPDTVAVEVAAHSDDAARALAAHSWLERSPDRQIPLAVAAWDLGAGESAVLARAVAHPGSLAILDDFAARTCAVTLGIPVVGTLGLALRAKLDGRAPSARLLVEELRKAGLYLSERLVQEALALVEE